jgi:uncharacterized protein (DUF433 family)
MSQPLHKDCRPHIGFPPRSTHWRPSDKFWATEDEFVRKDFDVPISDVFERAAHGRPSVAIDSAVLGGTPHISGTRIPVFMVLDAVEYFGTLEGVLKSYPNLTVEQIKDAVSFASAVTEHPVDYEVESSPR